MTGPVGRVRAVGGLLAAVLAAAVLTGCALDDEDAVAFTGPWAAEFQGFYGIADSDLARSILEDGAVTDAEIASVWDGFRRCLAEAGVELTEVGPDGSYSTAFGADVTADTANDATVSCSRTSGEAYVSPLYYGMIRNPENLDDATLIVDCMVAAGVVPVDYTAQRFRTDNSMNTIPLASGATAEAAAMGCQRDPLGTLG